MRKHGLRATDGCSHSYETVLVKAASGWCDSELRKAVFQRRTVSVFTTSLD